MSDETLESDVGIESDGHQQSIPAAPLVEQAAGEQETCNNGAAAAAPNTSLNALQQTKATNGSKNNENYDTEEPAKGRLPYEETKCDAGDLSVGTDSGDWSDSSGGNASNPDGRYNHYRPPISDNRPILSQADIEICMEIDQHFDHALQEQDISYTARFNSVRQSACFSVIFMLIYLTLGTVFFVQQADWTIADSLLFSVYTITTVGYGHLEHPQTPAFQMYTIMFIFIGIACLTIMVAQVYQCMALEATRAQHAQDIRDMSRQQATYLSRSQVSHPAAPPTTTSSNGSVVDEIVMNRDSWSDRLLRWMFRARVFFRDNEYGRSISVLFPFLGLILAGSLVVGPIEGWTVVESLYFAVVSLTTTGYGDYYPTRTASIWYCVLWLPFSIGFMSLFLGNVAAFYIRLSDANIERIESQLRRRLQRIKERQEKERREARRRALRGQELADTSEEETDLAVEIGTVEIENGQRQRRRMRSRRHHFDKLPTTEHPADDSADTASQGSRSSGSRGRRFLKSNRSMFPNRRDAILHNSRRPTNSSMSDQASAETLLPLPAATSMTTMRDVLMAVHRNIDKESSEGISLRSANDPEFEFLSIRSRTTVHRSLDDRSSVLRPSFALRALVQERLSEIIAAEIAGYTSNVDIHDNSMTITIDVLRETADKWMLPRRARKSFRSICFEALVFVGEHGLITRGADALYDLTPFEYHSLFAPLLAAMGDAETMAGWLASTQVLADVDLHRRTTLSVSTLTKNDALLSNVVDRVDSNENLQHELRLTID